MKAIPVFLLLAGSALAGEYAVLSSGARLYADRHEIEGGKVRLYARTGTTELPASQVTGFEAQDYVPPPAPQTAPPAPAPPDTRKVIDEVARRYDLPPRLLHSVIQAESGYRAGAVSPKGAMGLMQLMPGTAKAYGADAFDPAQNVEAGARYLSELLLKYRGGLYHALAAYNAGPGAVDRYNGIPPYRETREYILRILKSWKPGAE